MRAQILKRYGVVDRSELSVRAVKPDALWRVAISGKGDPLTGLDVGGAVRLSDELRRIGEDVLAAHIVEAANSASRSQAQGL